MKLWIVKPVAPLLKEAWQSSLIAPTIEDNPWRPWYDKCFGFVIRAETEEEARSIAQSHAGCEREGGCLERKYGTTQPWLDAQYSICEELTAVGEIGVLLRDKRMA